MRTYITVQGDMWDTIAYKAYGAVSCMDELIDANSRLRHQYVFPAGVEIEIPELETADLAGELPPWKRAEG